MSGFLYAKLKGTATAERGKIIRFKAKSKSIVAKCNCIALGYYLDYGVLETNYWTTLSGSFEVWRSEEYSTERVYSQLDGKGQLAWKYDGFSDIHLRARLACSAVICSAA